MKKLFVRAYFQSNLGDDLFVLQLVRRYPNVRFYLYALGENQNAFRDEANVRLPSAWNRCLRKLTHVLHLPRKEAFDGQGLDGTAAIGGSIFWEGAPLDDFDERTCLIGPNCEDSYSPQYQARLFDTLARVHSCCFRDRHSHHLFRELPTVSWAPDVLYGWTPRQTPCKGEGIGISVVSRKGVFRDEAVRERYYSAIAELCDLCAEQGIPVRLLGFCAPEGDGEAIAAIRSRVKQPDVLASVLYGGKPEEMLEEMNGCETILATRFHAMILGWVLGKNVVPIIYSSKQTHVLEDSGFHGPLWNALAGESATGRSLLDMIREEKGRLDITLLKKEARQQFAGLDGYIRDL